MQAFFSYIFTSRKTRSSKCQSWDGDVKKNHLCPGYVATVFFFFSNSKKKHIITEQTEHKIVGSPVIFPLPSPQPQRGGEGSWMSDWHVYPRTPPLFCIHLFAPPPGRGVRFFTPLTMGVSPAWHPIKKNGLKPVQKMALGPPLRSQDKIKTPLVQKRTSSFFLVLGCVIPSR